MLIGYARVSTSRQGESLETQRKTLEAAGCARVFEDQVSGAHSARPGLEAALDRLCPDDVLMVTRLDRLGRSAVDTMKTLSGLDERGVRFRALDFDLDTATPSGRLVVGIFVQLAQWERDLLIERTREGLDHARSQGRVGGRPRKLTAVQIESIRASRAANVGVADLAAMHGVSRWTITRALGGDES